MLRHPIGAEPKPAGDPAISRELWGVVVVLVLGTLLVILDTTIVNIALDPLTKDLHTSIGTIQWIVTGYLLSIAAVIPATGWLTRRFGPKRVYLASMVLFTAGSALCGISTSAGELIAFRVLQGLGGGAIAPIGQMILVRAAGPHQLPRVMSAYGVPTILAPVCGPTVGGVLLTDAGWRWIFFVNVPIGIVAILAGARKLPETQTEAAERIDGLGLLMVVAGLVGLTYGLSQIGATNSSVARAALSITLSLALLTGFIMRTLRVSWPLLDMSLYKNRIFASASVASFALGGALVGSAILMPLYFQEARHQSALNAGLLVAPRGIGATFGTWLSGRMMERLGTGVTAVLGASGILLATIPFIFLSGDTSFVYISIAGFVQGFAIGLCIMPAMTAAYRALRPEQLNDATPQLNILQRVGSSIGAAILIAVLTNQLGHGGASDNAHAHAFGVTFAWLDGLALIASLAAGYLMLVERTQERLSTATVSGNVEVLDAATVVVESG